MDIFTKFCGPKNSLVFWTTLYIQPLRGLGLSTGPILKASACGGRVNGDPSNNSNTEYYYLTQLPVYLRFFH